MFEAQSDWDYFEWDFGHLTCFHRRYDLGETHDHQPSDFNGWDDFALHLRNEHNAAVLVPVYMYEHGAIRLKVGSFQGLLPQGHAEFDSGQVGFAWATKREINAHLHTRKYDSLDVAQVAKVIEALSQEVDWYDDYLNSPEPEPETEEVTA